MHFQPRLDAVRGVCIAGVFLFHSHFLEFGWTGVQAFFVLSGYLITGILMDGKDASTSARGYFINFYARRALRIFPVYVAYLLIAFTLAVSVPGAMAHWVRSAIESNVPYLLTYTLNFHRFVSPLGPFLEHLWSLSVEEQFYLVWPLLVFCFSKRHVVNMCLCLVLAGPVFRLLELTWVLSMEPHNVRYASLVIYYSTFSHIDAFALGALLNFAQENALAGKVVRVASKYAPAFFLLISAWMLLLARLSRYDDVGTTSLGWPANLPYYYASVWGYSLLNMLFFVLIANINSIPLIPTNIFLQRLGRISYGFYIFHLPILSLVFNFVKANEWIIDARSVGAGAIAFCLTWFVSEISYRYLETPFLKMKGRFATEMKGNTLAAVARPSAQR